MPRVNRVGGGAIIVEEPRGELRKRWHCGRELARLGRRDPSQALEVLGGGGSKGAANRGLCFFVTRCGGYIVKQESSSTLRTLDNVAKTYAARASVQGSLLPRLVGAYTVRSNTTTTHWLVMANTFAGAPKVKAVYDVKGSTAGRRTRPKKGTLKDLDARDDAATLACHGSGEVVEALSGDTRVLEQLRLLTARPSPASASRVWRGGGGALPTTGPRDAHAGCRDRGFLVVGLIDVLQPWTWAKVAEYYCRGALRGWRRISAVPPVFYRRRFLAFVSRLLDT